MRTVGPQRASFLPGCQFLKSTSLVTSDKKCRHWTHGFAFAYKVDGHAVEYFVVQCQGNENTAIHLENSCPPTPRLLHGVIRKS